MRRPPIVDIVSQVYPGVRFVGDWKRQAFLVVGEHPNVSHLVLDVAEARRCGEGLDLANWMSRQVETLLSNHAQPVNQMVPWREALPSVDAATYLLGADL